MNLLSKIGYWIRTLIELPFAYKSIRSNNPRLTLQRIEDALSRDLSYKAYWNVRIARWCLLKHYPHLKKEGGA